MPCGFLGALWDKFCGNCTCNYKNTTIIVGTPANSERQAQFQDVISQQGGLQAAVLNSRKSPGLIRQASVQTDSEVGPQDKAAGLVSVVQPLMDLFQGTDEERWVKVAAAAAQVGVNLVQKYNQGGAVTQDEHQRIREHAELVSSHNEAAELLWKTLKRERIVTAQQLEQQNKTTSAEQRKILAQGLARYGSKGFWEVEKFDDLDGEVQKIFLAAAKLGATEEQRKSPGKKVRRISLEEDEESRPSSESDHFCEKLRVPNMIDHPQANKALGEKRLELVCSILEFNYAECLRGRLDGAQKKAISDKIQELKGLDGAMFHLFSGLRVTSDDGRLKSEFGFTPAMLGAIQVKHKRERQLIQGFTTCDQISSLPIESLILLYNIVSRYPKEKLRELGQAYPLSKWLESLPKSPDPGSSASATSPAGGARQRFPDDDDEEGVRFHVPSAPSSADSALRHLRKESPPETPAPPAVVIAAHVSETEMGRVQIKRGDSDGSGKSEE